MSSTSELINTGIMMGIIHVLTGPAHLSALATLSGTNIQGHTRRKAFLLGVRWGIGHSFGLLIVGGLLIAMEESSGEWIGMDPVVSTILESFVGVFMLALGSYGLLKADKNNRDSILSDMNHHLGDACGLKLQEEDCGGEMVEISDDIAAQMEDVLDTDSRCSGYDDLSQCLSTDDYLSDILEATGGPSDLSFVTVPMKHQQVISKAPGLIGPMRGSTNNLMTAASLVHKHTDNSILSDPRGGHCERYFYLCCGDYGRKFFLCTPGILALVAGLVHGVAGPGGVLGVIPAVELRDAKLALVYLGTFCLTSTFVMGGFAVFYGGLSEWLAGGRDKRETVRQQSRVGRVFMVEMGSALLSICVGVIWLVLLVIGKFDSVFP